MNLKICSVFALSLFATTSVAHARIDHHKPVDDETQFEQLQESASQAKAAREEQAYEAGVNGAALQYLGTFLSEKGATLTQGLRRDVQEKNRFFFSINGGYRCRLRVEYQNYYQDWLQHEGKCQFGDQAFVDCASKTDSFDWSRYDAQREAADHPDCNRNHRYRGGD